MHGARAIIAGLLTMLFAFAVTLIAADALGLSFLGISESSQSGEWTLTGDALLTSNRDRLQICVDVVDSDADGRTTPGDETIVASPLETAPSLAEGTPRPAPSPNDQDFAARNAVSGAVGEASKNEFWDDAGFASAEPQIDAGCPIVPQLLEAGVRIEPTRKAGVIVTPFNCVASPGIYRTMIFVISENSLLTKFNGEYPTTPAEWVSCETHNPQHVTTGLYVTADQLQDQHYMAGWILAASGVEPPDPDIVPRPPASQ
jgi:hypothetical protein